MSEPIPQSRAATLEVDAAACAGEPPVVLICYDGSADARTAIEQAGPLLRGRRAVVLTVWEPFMARLTHRYAGLGSGPGMLDTEPIDDAASAEAHARASAGVRLARSVGFDAEARVRMQHPTVAETIFAEARAIDADAILLGSRGLTRLKSLVIGSVARSVLRRAPRLVILASAPSPAAAADLDERRERDAARAAPSIPSEPVR